MYESEHPIAVMIKYRLFSKINDGYGNLSFMNWYFYYGGIYKGFQNDSVNDRRNRVHSKYRYWRNNDYYDVHPLAYMIRRCFANYEFMIRYNIPFIEWYFYYSRDLRRLRYMRRNNYKYKYRNKYSYWRNDAHVYIIRHCLDEYMDYFINKPLPFIEWYFYYNDELTHIILSRRRRNKYRYWSNAHVENVETCVDRERLESLHRYYTEKKNEN